jgi:hypothetical protein
LPTDQTWHVRNLINFMLTHATTDRGEGSGHFNKKRPPHFSGALRCRGKAWEALSAEAPITSTTGAKGGLSCSSSGKFDIFEKS